MPDLKATPVGEKSFPLHSSNESRFARKESGEPFGRIVPNLGAELPRQFRWLNCER